MRILAVDTTTPNGSVAVCDGEEVIGSVCLGRQENHSRTLLPAVEFLLASLALEPRGLDFYAVTVGPGSFTGLRVGISSVQGLALASGARCFGLSALDVMAYRIRGESSRLVALMDAYRDEVYAGLYDAYGAPMGGPRVGPPQALLPGLPADAAFVGEGARRHRELIMASCGAARFPERSPYLAPALGRKAASLGAASAMAPEELRPLYLREAEIRKPAPR